MPVLAFDKQTQRRTDENGYLHVTGSALTKTTVNPYFGHEIPDGEALGLDPDKIYQVLRPAEELAKAVDTFNGMPILIMHEEDSAFDPQKALRIGTTGTRAVWQDPYIINDVVFHDATAIALIETNQQKELSSGYRFTVRVESGTFEGVPYDLVMINIRCNHVALVKMGRAGPDVVVADSSPFSRGFIMNFKKTALALAAALVSKKVIMAKDEASVAQVVEDALGDEPVVDVDPSQAVVPPAAEGDVPARLAKIEALLLKLCPEVAGDEEGGDGAPPPAVVQDEEGGAPPPVIAKDTALKKPIMALDAAAIAANVHKTVTAQFAAKEKAIEAVMPLVGRVSGTAFDSAEGVYKFALEQRGIAVADYNPAAYEGMVAVMAKSKPDALLLAEDSAPSGVMEGIDLDRFGAIGQ